MLLIPAVKRNLDCFKHCQLIAAFLIFISVYQSVSAQECYGISGNNLIKFDAAAPAVILSSNLITGFSGGMEISCLDFRPATGELYALGYVQASGMARLHVINTTTATATAIGATAVLLQANMGKISMDFNPTVDRIRIVGSNNSNFRLHPVTGAVVATDGALAFASGDPNVNQNPSIGAIAYTNSYIGATSTTLINFDDSLNVFCAQIPPNNGTLNTIGSAGIIVDLVNTATDFDIYFDQLSNTNLGLFCANLNLLNTTSALFKVNLTTGLTTLVGNIGGLGMTVKDFACKTPKPSNNPVTGHLAVVLTTNNNLITFDTDHPTEIRTQIGITGITSGQVLVGMDFRPATGELIGLGYDASTQNCQLYKIDYTSGIVTAINATPFTLQLGNGISVGFDFNPTVDRIRVVAANNVNVRLNPVTGAIVATDTNLSFATGDLNAMANAAISAAAYSNSFSGATSTTLFVYDDSLNVLCTQIPPNNGILNTIGGSNIVLNLADPSIDFDIYYDHVNATNIGFAIANTIGSNFDLLFEIDPASGAFSNGVQLGYGCAAKDLAIVIDSIPSTTAVFSPEQLNIPFQAMPNPIAEWTIFNFDLPFPAEKCQFILTNAQGQIVANAHQENLVAGRNTFNWTVGSNPAGLYVATLFVDGQLRASTRVAVIR